MERMVPTQEEIQRRFLDGLPERLESLREAMGLSWRDLASRLDVADERVAAWRKGRAPSGDAMYALLQLAAGAPGGLEALYPEFAPGSDDDEEEGEEPWA
ncbi:MAG: helix-turn-helix transcriptional regulator [Chloroflexota bacterium]|nr:helix-turn-helix transcriptional regulator [Chloroflexota bacterium]